MSPVVAVVGAGAWGRNHVWTFHSLNALAGVVETSDELRRKWQEELPGIRVWESLKQALPFATGVVIATPADTHADLASQALAAGKGVLVEKPMALEAKGAEAMLLEAQIAGGTLMVGHLLLYQPAIARLKELIDAGTIGQVYRISQERLKHGRVRATESALWSFAPHDVAVLLYLMDGPPVEVNATGACFLQPGIHDDVHLELTFSGDRSAHIHAGWYWPCKRATLQVFGSTGMLVYDEADQTLTLHRKHLAGGRDLDRLKPVDAGTFPLFQGHGEPLLLEDQHFLDCLASGERPRSDGQSGLEVVRVLEWADFQLKDSRSTHPQESA
jgi:predicted dehydrogenase